MSDYRLVDVFGSGPFTGNPVAVVTGKDDLDTETMLRITQWFNLSETTFLLPATDSAADYRVRIFTPDRELPFAGHPTLGTCHAWLEQGGQPRNPDHIVQQCSAGLINLRRVDGRLAFSGPPLVRSGSVDPQTVERVAAFLRVDRDRIVDIAWVDNGPGWIGVMLGSAEEVLALDPLRSYAERIEVGVIGPHEGDGPLDYEIRTFFTNHTLTIIEDPITGSFNASVAEWLYGSGRVDRAYVAAQGTKLGRSGRVYVDRDDAGAIWIAGDTQTLVRGTPTF